MVLRGSRNHAGERESLRQWRGNGYATYTGGTSWGITDVGAYGANSDSYYGTNDQAGNVWEWNDAVISGSSRGLRGGSWNDFEDFLRSSFRVSNL